MRSEAVQKIVGRPVKDIYGRYVGYVVGFSVDTTGELRSVGADQGSGEFVEYPSNRIVSDKDGLIVIPSWKVDTDSLAKETEMVRRRAQALEDLKKEGEIPSHVYDEMYKQYSGQLRSLQESYNNLGQRLRRRVEELDHQGEVLERFLANVKVQFRSGETDEATFKVASDYCLSMKSRDAKEKEDIARVLSLITAPLTPEATTAITPETETVAIETVATSSTNQ